MILNEYVYGLFPYDNFAFPEGKFNIPFTDKVYDVDCRKVFLLLNTHFEAIEELKIFFQSIQKQQKEFINSIPFIKEYGIIIYANYFDEYLDKFYEKDNKIKSVIYGLASQFYYISIRETHEFDENQIHAIDYIKQVRDEAGISKAKSLFFVLSRKLHECVSILSTPYVNLLDFNHIYMKGMYSFFTKEDGNRYTNVIPYYFDFYFPNSDIIKPKVQDYFNNRLDIPLDDLFLAKAKVYLRLENYSMAIIHAVIALEIIVPKYINGYLKLNNINKKVIEDFNNKFGLSVRVKALLKLMIPSEYHHLITNVGTIISYRNKIMHEGQTNDYFRNINNVSELISDCESLINALKEIGTEKKIFT